MLVRIVMEIAKIEGQIPKDIVVKGYRYSRHGTVAFILHDVKADALNKILDPIVPTLSLDIPGVRYLDIGAQADVYSAISSARLVISFSPQFDAMACCVGGADDHASNRRRVYRVARGARETQSFHSLRSTLVDGFQSERTPLPAPCAFDTIATEFRTIPATYTKA